MPVLPSVYLHILNRCWTAKKKRGDLVDLVTELEEEDDHFVTCEVFFCKNRDNIVFTFLSRLLAACSSQKTDVSCLAELFFSLLHI